MKAEDINALNERIDAEHACSHEVTELRVYTKANGSQEIRRQCQRCGVMVEAVKERLLSPERLAALPAWDEALRERWRDVVNGARTAAFRQAQEAERAAWFRDYHIYLQSPEWWAKRQAVLDRDMGLCQECDADAEHVHHLTYAHYGAERLYELVSLCFACHDAAHDGALSRGDRRVEEG